MYKSLVENYIKNMSFEDLNKYISKNYPFVTLGEKKVIYEYLKNRWQELYHEDEKILLEIKEKVSASTYQEILKLLNMAYQIKNR